MPAAGSTSARPRDSRASTQSSVVPTRGAGPLDHGARAADNRCAMTTMTPYHTRRAAVFEQIGAGVAIVPTAPERMRNRDSDYLYRFDSYFYYLTGFPEPDAVLVLLAGASPKAVLFCRDKHPERELWEGFRYGPEAAREAFGF